MIGNWVCTWTTQTKFTLHKTRIFLKFTFIELTQNFENNVQLIVQWEYERVIEILRRKAEEVSFFLGETDYKD